MPVIPLLIYFAILGILVWYSVRSDVLPDQLTWGGVFCGLVVSAIFPQLHGHAHLGAAILSSLGGAVVGYLAGWLVVEGGKLCFGTSRINSSPEMFFQVVGKDGRCQFVLEDMAFEFDEIFSRTADELILKIVDIRLATSVALEATEIKEIAISHDTLRLNDLRVPLDKVTHISGVCSEVRVPREVMGFGIVKMMAFVGAFLGWQGALIIFGSTFALFFIVALLTVPFKSPGRMAFAPFAMAASLGYVIFLTRF